MNSTTVCSLSVFAPGWCSLALHHKVTHRSQGALLAVINVLVFGSRSSKLEMPVLRYDTYVCACHSYSGEQSG
jgi:hypothetical protein